jgi:hypothetical protein
MRSTVSGFTLLVLFSCALSAHAQSAGNLQKLLTDEASRLQAWGSDPVIVAAVKAQNAKRATAAQVKSLDEQWSAGKAESLVKQVTTGACADHQNHRLLARRRSQMAARLQRRKRRSLHRPPQIRRQLRATPGANLHPRARQRRGHWSGHGGDFDRQAAEVIFA